MEIQWSSDCGGYWEVISCRPNGPRISCGDLSMANYPMFLSLDAPASCMRLLGLNGATPNDEDAVGYVCKRSRRCALRQ